MLSYLFKSKAISHADINKFIKCANWSNLLSMLFVYKSSVVKMSDNDSILHHVCKFHPPLYIIKYLYQINPKAFFITDDKERYALHIACKHGCSPKVIKYLRQKNPDAAKKPDKKYRTPIHLACKSYVKKSDRDWDTANNRLIKVVQEVMDVAPLSATREDSKGKTALEYATECKLSLFVIEFLDRRYKHNQKGLLDESVDLENHMYQVRLQHTDIHSQVVFPQDKRRSNSINKQSTKSFQVKPSHYVKLNQSRARSA